MNCSYYTSPDDMPDYVDEEEEEEIFDDYDMDIPYDDYDGRYDDGVLL